MNLHIRILPPRERITYSLAMAANNPALPFVQRHEMALDAVEKFRDRAALFKCRSRDISKRRLK